jgi:uncharacterized protein with ParB-like and HNH nuclease domain
VKPSIKSLGEVLFSLSQYVIPVFQRNYRWERPQWEKFWLSLTEIRKPEKSGNHFMGFLVFVPGLAQPGQHTRFHLIDGQQRLTTSCLLLAALRNVARRSGQGELAEEVHADYLVHPRKKGDEHYRLLPKEQDYASFVAIVECKTPPAGRIADALTYFEQQVGAVSDVDLRAFFNVVCQRLEFMCATLEAENAYNIFKSLNSTGVPLGPSDLIRNFVFMHVAPDDQDDFDRTRWAPLEALFTTSGGRLDEESFSRFFRDTLMMDGRYVQPKDTFSTFESRYEATGFSPAVLADALLANARDYATIEGRNPDNDPTVTEALHGLNLLESSTTYPLLLALFRRRAEGMIDSVQLARCIQMLRGFILRRFICGESSRGYGQTFVRALGREAGDPVAALEAYLLERGWPDDRRFIEAFVRFPLYKRGYARAVLTTLERERGHKEPAVLEAAQIEHVMPQTLRHEWIAILGDDAESVHADWLHQPGNLTLSAYNQELGNQAFEQKRARFAESNIVLTRELAEATTWNASVIQARGETMAATAALLWPGPKEPHLAQDEPDDDDPEGGLHRHELRRKFWNGFLAHVKATHPEVPAFEPRQYKTIRLKSGVTHVGVELRHQLRPSEVAIDVYFWREAVFSVWEKLQLDKSAIDALVGDSWSFGRPNNDGHPRWMSVTLAADSDDESEWPTLFGWLGQKLAQVYALVLPYLRSEIGVSPSPTLDMDDEEPGEDGPSETKRQQQRFWGVLAEAISGCSTTLRPQKPLPQHWTNYTIGRAGFFIVPTVNSRDDRIGVELVIGSANAKQQFHALQAQRDAIEAGLGFPVEWQELPHRNMSRIGCWRAASAPEDETRWPEYVEWMVERITRIEAVFRPLVRELP